MIRRTPTSPLPDTPFPYTTLFLSKASRWPGPSTAAGSSIPQCAVIGLPGQAGQVSPAALSQTVKMKSSLGASGPETSSQLFERRPSGSNPTTSSRASVWAWTVFGNATGAIVTETDVTPEGPQSYGTKQTGGGA